MSTVQTKQEEKQEDNYRSEYSLEEIEDALGWMKKINTLVFAAGEYRKIKQKEKEEEEKVDKAKVDEFAGYLYKVYALAMTRAQMINRIFDENHIDCVEKGFLMREMAIAVKRVMPEYKDISVDRLMRKIMLPWFTQANILRMAHKSGYKLHPTEYGGRYLSRWHIQSVRGDHEKQCENLTLRVQFAEKTLQNRLDEWTELQEKRAQSDDMIIQPQQIMNNDQQIVGGE